MRVLSLFTPVLVAAGLAVALPAQAAAGPKVQQSESKRWILSKPAEPPSAEPEPYAKGMSEPMHATVAFAFGSADLDDTSKKTLDDVARSITSKPRELTVEGHADATGSAPFNQELSEKRAQAVRDYLSAQGVMADQINTKALGESEPVASNDTQEGRALNRRVDLQTGGER